MGRHPLDPISHPLLPQAPDRPAHQGGRAPRPTAPRRARRPWAASPSWERSCSGTPSATSAPRSASPGRATSPSGPSWPSASSGTSTTTSRCTTGAAWGSTSGGSRPLQLLCALVFAELAVHWAHSSTALSLHPRRRHRHQPRAGRLGDLSPCWSWSGSSNAVNITDGVDGLAAGVGHVLLRRPVHHGVLDLPARFDLPRPPGFGDRPLTRGGRALAGACIGFLWWNAAPAKIIMGDTGSLAIGAGLAALCLLLNLDLLLLRSSAGSSSWRPCR